MHLFSSDYVATVDTQGRFYFQFFLHEVLFFQLNTKVDHFFYKIEGDPLCSFVVEVSLIAQF